MIEFLSTHYPTLLVLLGLLLCSGFFSGTETALFSLTREQLGNLRKSRNPAAGVALQLVRDPRSLLVTVLLGNMVVNVLYFSIAAVLTQELGNLHGTWAATLAGIGTLLGVIIGGEILPKAVGVAYPSTFATVTAVPMSVWQIAITPLRVAMSWLAGLMEPKRFSEHERYLTPDELKMLVATSQETGDLEMGEQEIIEDILELAEIRVCEIMSPRVDLVQIDIETPIPDVLRLARQKTFSMLPVYAGSVDEIVGIVQVRDLFLSPDRPGGVRAYMSRPKFVPETKRADELLREMLSEQRDIVVVVDEYGGVSGIVTLEDLFETFVGEIDDEFEAPAGPPVEEMGDNRYRLDGNLSVREWAEQMGLTERESPFPAEINTVAGFVMYLLGRLPHRGDTVQWRNLRFTVERVRGRRIDQILLELVDDGSVVQEETA